MSFIVDKMKYLLKKNTINNNDNNNINNDEIINQNNINENDNNVRCPCNNKATGIVYINKYYNHNFLVCPDCLQHILLHVLIDNYIKL